jgi:hypothetical protein
MHLVRGMCEQLQYSKERSSKCQRSRRMRCNMCSF